MSKATDSPTTNPSPWRAAQLRQKARGKGKHPMPHGRYSATKKTLHNGVVDRSTLTLPPDQIEALLSSRPRACETLTFLSVAQIEALEELCTLSAYSMGFSYSPAMERVVRAIADKAGPAARVAYFARASKRERIEIRA